MEIQCKAQSVLEDNKVAHSGLASHRVVGNIVTPHRAVAQLVDEACEELGRVNYSILINRFSHVGKGTVVSAWCVSEIR